LPALASSDLDAPDPFFAGQRVGRLFATDVDKIQVLNHTATWAEATGYVSQDLSHWSATGMGSDDALLSGLAAKMKRRLDVADRPVRLPSRSDTVAKGSTWRRPGGQGA
jgi:hypothetical protein